MENNKKPITVLMAVYNEQPEFLKKSIESVLSQTFSDFEFLIVDDGTSPENIEILEEFARNDGRLKIIRNDRNFGLTKSLNRGLKEARGKYIARIDSDDLAEKTRLEKQFQFMESNPGCALCGSWANLIDKNNQVIGQKKFLTDPQKIRRKILFFNFFTHSSLFFRKDIALENNGYNEKIKKAQDYDLILKISARHLVANLPEFLCSLRITPQSISSKNKKKQEWYGLIARKNAILEYGFPKKEFWKILPAVFYFLFVPYSLEKIIFKFIHK